LSALRDFVAQNPALALALGGIAIGFLFGAVVEATGFCVMGAVSDMMTSGDTRRFRAWVLAIAAAIIGAHALDSFEVVSLDQSMYRGARLNWAGNILGGLMFGFGMVLAGGCASRNLVRAGAGDLRSAFTVLVVGLFAYMTTGGVFGPWRANLEDATAVTLPEGASSLTGMATYMTSAQVAAAAGASHETMGLALLIAGALLLYCFISPAFRASRVHILAGLGVGAAVVAGWMLTGLAHDDMALAPQAPLSLSFVKPTGDALEWLERSTALGLPSFGAATVLGTLLGAFVSAFALGRLRLATFADTGDTLRNLGGAAFMGVGGVLALGCTIGQGVSGLSTLALGSILAFLGIVGGGVLGMKALERFA
jgi:uncharacterized membrane protein YedE/YeeE